MKASDMHMWDHFYLGVHVVILKRRVNVDHSALSAIRSKFTPKPRPKPSKGKASRRC